MTSTYWKVGLLFLSLLMAALLFWLEMPLIVELPIYKTVEAAKSEELTISQFSIETNDFRSWTRSNGNAESNRYSSLKQINKSNVSTLKIAWTYTSESSANIQANPIVVSGMVIFPTPGNYIVAVDGATGIEQWRFKTKRKPAKRGLVWWPGNDSIDSRIYFSAGTNLYALSLEGKLVSEFGDGGIVAGDNMSLVAPAIANNTIIYPIIGYPNIGNPSVEGIDVVTGKILWKTLLLEPLPSGGMSDLNTYAGGNPWSGVSVDEIRGLAYVTTGNPKPNFIGVNRPGNNKNANSLIAIDISNGKIVWSFQEIAHDIWDKDIPAPPILTHIVRNGVRVDVVVAVTKHGNTVLLDRVSGKPIYPWRLKRAPRSELYGEKTAEYQPDVELPEPFSKQVFGIDDLTNIGPQNFAFAKSILEQANTGAFPTFSEGKDTIFFGLRGGAEWPGAAVDPVTNILYVSSNDVPWRIQVMNVAGLDQISFPETPQRKLYIQHCSACHGHGLQGVNSNPALYGIDQRRSEIFINHLVRTGRRGMPKFDHLQPDVIKDIVGYIQSARSEFDQQKKEEEKLVPPRYHYTGWRIFRDNEGYPANKPPWGWLNALDLNTGRLVWKVPLGTDKSLEGRGLGTVGTENLGGPVVTGGDLIFVTGTTDNLIRAFDKNTGRELWSHELPFMGSAPPTVYMVNGRQFLLVPATGGTLENPVIGNTFVAYALPAQ